MKNMVKNEIVLLDPYSNGLWGWGAKGCPEIHIFFKNLFLSEFQFQVPSVWYF